MSIDNKDFKLTEDELKRLSEAMKKEEFRKLLVDYAQEISDPANRELYEREIRALEAERGMDVTFIHPEPGYCIKTRQVIYFFIIFTILILLLL